MSHTRSRVPLALAVGMLLGWVLPAAPVAGQGDWLSALVSRADRIVVGEVLESRAFRAATRDGEVPMTLVTLRVARTLKGAATVTLILELPGGEFDGDRLEILGMPRFAVGDREVLFLHGTPGTISPILGLTEGRFRVLKADDDTPDRVATHEGRPLTLGPRPLSLAAFERAILTLVAAGRNDRRPYIAGQPEDLPDLPAPVAASLPGAVRLGVSVDLGASPTLLDGCPDWSCALRSREEYRRLTTVTNDRQGATDFSPEFVSLRWGHLLYDQPLSDDVPAITVRRSNDEGTTTAILFNSALRWDSYLAAGKRPTSPGVLDLPGVATRQLTMLALSLESTAAADQDAIPPTGAAGAQPTRRAPGSQPGPRIGSGAAVRSRSTLTDGPFDLSASAGCEGGGAFINPRLVSFQSPDHSLMTGYQVGFFQPGASSPTQVVDLPLTGFLIRKVIDLPSWAVWAMQSSLVASISSAGLTTPMGIVYTYRVRGVWAGGTTSWSEPSQPFVRCPS